MYFYQLKAKSVFSHGQYMLTHQKDSDQCSIVTKTVNFGMNNYGISEMLRVERHSISTVKAVFIFYHNNSRPERTSIMEGRKQIANVQLVTHCQLLQTADHQMNSSVNKVFPSVYMEVEVFGMYIQHSSSSFIQKNI